jgi:hypothetical protein
VLLRDTKDRDGGHLTVGSGDAAAFVAAVAAREFDHLL